MLVFCIAGIPVPYLNSLHLLVKITSKLQPLFFPSILKDQIWTTILWVGVMAWEGEGMVG